VIVGALLLLAAFWLLARWRRFRRWPNSPDAEQPATITISLSETASPQQAGTPGPPRGSG